MSDRSALLFEKLKELSIEVKTYVHPPLHTVEESQALRGTIPGAHTKNLFLRDRKDRHFLVTALEDAEIDLKSIHTLIGGSGRVSFGKADTMEAWLGVRPGAVTPFGAINDRDGHVKVILDEDLVKHDMVNAHPLHNEATTSLKTQDLIRFLEAVNHPPAILKVSL
ncbi:prolyl-tRNA synthetase associated domain-containing protein [Nitratireductor basaltis]|uniref:DNA-binding protein n=1 Tax=Nitratireductor basaltis TaxID=472175 RepID=A0A084U6D9_9HYPH|nr:prolyl-tRNA synthetase associated domain-containing protein [Nitratireductor basaltis]KFB08525.1 DNA-binding protein [Nitratireductor basaltis]